MDISRMYFLLSEKGSLVPKTQKSVCQIRKIKSIRIHSEESWQRATEIRFNGAMGERLSSSLALKQGPWVAVCPQDYG